MRTGKGDNWQREVPEHKVDFHDTRTALEAS